MSLIDLRDEIEVHCKSCVHLGSSDCDVCFFASVDLSFPGLGNRKTYNRAYHYLRTLRSVSFERFDTFGTRIHIERKAAMR